jgi:hypothetical protein
MAISVIKDPFQEHLHDNFDCGLQVYLQYSVKSILSSLLISASSKVRSTTAAASSLLKFRVPCTSHNSFQSRGKRSLSAGASWLLNHSVPAHQYSRFHEFS